MKRAIISALFAAGVVGVASADIQAPPASEYTPTRKLAVLSPILFIPLKESRWESSTGRAAREIMPVFP